MTREDLFNNMKIKKGNHYCMFCDGEANFVISNENTNPTIEYPMCKKCALLFSKKIIQAFDKNF